MAAQEERAEPAVAPRVADASLRAARPEVGQSRHERASDRRGPFRPGQLVPTRAKMNGQSIARLFRFVDLLIIAVLGWAACLLASPGGLLAAPLGHVLPFVFGALAAIWGLEASGAYELGPREALSIHLLKTAGGFGLGALGVGLILLAVSATLPIATAAGAWFTMSFAFVYLAHAIWWSRVKAWRAAGRLTPNIVVVGATANAERLILGLLESHEANVLGVFDDRLGRVPDAICGVPVLGTAQAMIGHRIMPYVDRVVITVPSTAQNRVRQLVQHLRVLPNDVSLFLDFQSESEGGAALSRLANSPLAQVCGAPRDEARAFWKRAQDLVFGVVALVLALPVMAVVALAVRLDSRGPILFRQRRHGFNNEEIVVWKFRSMRHESADATAARQVTAGDDRVTRVGHFIRKMSLDELPQILNVLKGDMSLVGPRPHAIGMKTGDEESARLVAEYAHRHRIKPGITGWAAIHGSRGPVHTPADVRARVALDVEYIERQSFWLDLYIMAMTLPCLLGDRAGVR
jgi:Undecaprenyl-phosphate glucose phosphotransferase